VTDLADFLLARIAEDERDAREAVIDDLINKKPDRCDARPAELRSTPRRH
jgi:hypothetical protein